LDIEMVRAAFKRNATPAKDGTLYCCVEMLR